MKSTRTSGDLNLHSNASAKPSKPIYGIENHSTELKLNDFPKIAKPYKSLDPIRATRTNSYKQFYAREQLETYFCSDEANDASTQVHNETQVGMKDATPSGKNIDFNFSRKAVTVKLQKQIRLEFKQTQGKNGRALLFAWSKLCAAPK